MKMTGRSWMVCLLAMSAATLGCGDDNNRHTGKHDIWFMGAVVDGASGAPITTYDISLVWGTSTVKGKVDAGGRYTLGPFPAWNDYGILINSANYRAFSSYNAQIAPPMPTNTSLASDVYSADTTQTFIFDASLFPTAVAAPDVSIAVIETGPMPKAAAGNYRLQPTSQPPLVAQTSEVGGQSWTNDRDLYAAALSGPFTGGAFVIPGSQMVYGVSYTVSIYGVDGYQPTGANNPVTVQAGVNTGQTVSLIPTTVAPLVIVSNTIAACKAPLALTDTSAAVVTLTFNEPFEDGTLLPGANAEALDNGLVVNFANFSSMLAPNLSSTMQEHGTSFTIADNVLTLAWNPNVGILPKGVGDSVRSVTYGGLGSIILQPKNHPVNSVSLSALLNQAMLSTTITCTP